MTLTTDASAQSTTWFVSTVLLTALGFFMWPQSFAAIYSAKNGEVLRKNAIALPLYQLMLLCVYFAGFTALIVMPGLKGPAADQSFLLVVAKYYPPWVLGSVALAGCLAALVPASGQLLGAASIVAKNVIDDGFGIAKSDEQRLLATRLLVLVVAALALAWWLVARTSLVGLLLIGYNGVTQFLPGVVIALRGWGVSALAIGAGIVAGVAAVIALAFLGYTTLNGVNVGLFALGLNALVVAAVQVASAPRAARAGIGRQAP
jgi:SSS family solute:Na+ symporter